MKVLQVAVAVDEARENGLALGVDHLGAGGNGDRAAPADGLEPAALDNDDGVLDRRPAGAVDQSAALDHERFFRHGALFLPEPNNVKRGSAKRPDANDVQPSLVDPGPRVLIFFWTVRAGSSSTG